MIKSLDIAIPLFNEEDSVENLYTEIQKVKETLNNNNIYVKILLVNDGSTDKTEKKLNQYFKNMADVLIINHSKNKNLGGFLNTVIGKSNSEFVVFLDSDCTFAPIEIVNMVNEIDDITDIVNGSPYHPSGSILGVKHSRLLISKTANRIYQLLVRRDLFTYTSIFKLYRNDLIKNIKIENKGFVAVTELFVKGLKKSRKTVEFPCQLSIRTTGESKINILNSLINHVKFMFKIKFNQI
jgi:dolichol-phosphate mannosyltransferase